MSVIGRATSGMAGAMQRFDANAAAIARQEIAEDRKEGLAEKVAQAAAARAEVQANAAVARTGSRTLGALVDILA